MESKPEIFFSYAWGDQNETGSSREKIVNDLYVALVAAGFNVIRDKNDLRYKGLISDLIQRIGRGKFIIVAISDKYLKSAYCMSELMEIYRRSNSDIDELLQKIFPIILEDAKIYQPEDRVDYLEYWETKKEALSKELKGIELENAATFAEELRVYDEIIAVIPILSSLLRDMNTLSIQKLSANNFEEVKNAIIKAASPEPVSFTIVAVDKPKTRSTIPKFRGWKAAVIIVVIIGLLALFLHLGHLSTTKISMELSVSEMNFTLPQQQVLTNIMKLSSIGASGLENVMVPDVNTQSDSGREGSSSAVLLSIDTTNSHTGTITLDALPLPAGMRIGIRHTDVTGEYRFFFQGKPIDLPVQVNGHVNMILPPNPPEFLNFTSPGLIKMQSGKEGVDLDLNLQSPTSRIFPGEIAADSISLLRIDENHDDENSTVRTVSTILSGTIYFMGGKKQVLVPGQKIQFTKSHGTINSLELFDDHIAIHFVGTVSGLASGESNNRTNLMPTYLEWLNSRVSLYLLVVVVLVVSGIIFGLRRFKHASN